MQSEIKVLYASDVEHDDFIAEFYCGNDQWGEMTLDPASGRYNLRIWGTHSREGCVVDVAELEQVLGVAKERITPLEPETK